MDVRVKRVYAPPAPDDGFRILVDRIWPRGISKAGAALDLWLIDVAPRLGLAVDRPRVGPDDGGTERG